MKVPRSTGIGVRRSALSKPVSRYGFGVWLQPVFTKTIVFMLAKTIAQWVADALFMGINSYADGQLIYPRLNWGVRGCCLGSESPARRVALRGF